MRFHDLMRDANRQADLDRQRTVGRKYAGRQTEAQVIDVLCARAEELALAIKANQPLAGPVRSLMSAVAIARKNREERR